MKYLLEGYNHNHTWHKKPSGNWLPVGALRASLFRPSGPSGAQTNSGCLIALSVSLFTIVFHSLKRHQATSGSLFVSEISPSVFSAAEEEELGILDFPRQPPHNFPQAPSTQPQQLKKHAPQIIIQVEISYHGGVFIDIHLMALTLRKLLNIVIIFRVLVFCGFFVTLSKNPQK